MTAATIVAQLEALDAQILAEYAAGLSMTAISKKLSLELDDVTAAVTDFAEMDRGKARDLALAWQKTAKAATWRAQRDAQADTQPQAQRHTEPAPAVEPKREVTVALDPEPDVASKSSTSDGNRTDGYVIAGGQATWTSDTASSAAGVVEPLIRVHLDNREATFTPEEPNAIEDVDPKQSLAWLAVAISEAERTGDAELVMRAAKLRKDLADLRAAVDEHHRTAELREELERIEARAAEIRAQLEPAKADAYERPDRAESAAIRQWARQTNREVHDTGMLPRALVEAYRAAVAR